MNKCISISMLFATAFSAVAATNTWKSAPGIDYSQWKNPDNYEEGTAPKAGTREVDPALPTVVGEEDPRPVRLAAAALGQRDEVIGHPPPVVLARVCHAFAVADQKDMHLILLAKARGR